MNDQPKAPHGGARPGSGRKAVDGVTDRRQYSVQLDPECLRIALSLGEGNKSAGIRAALLLAAKVKNV